MKQEIFDFDNPWRPIYEAPQALGWLGAAAGCVATGAFLPLPTSFAAVAAGTCAIAGAYRGAKAYARRKVKARALCTTKSFITVPELIQKAQQAAKTNHLWLGEGFQWTDIEANTMHSLLGGGVAAQLGREATAKDGAYWLHGLAREQDVLIDMSMLDGHTLIVGTTRVGKTRCFDLLIGQAIARGEPVIIIDPKGDHGLAENARRVCEVLGQSERFVYFHPAHPEKSASIDPLRNWNRKTELASRVAALIPSETGADPFTAFGWKVINDIVGGLIATGKRPNLVELRRYIEGGPDELLLKALREHFRRHMPEEWERKSEPYVRKKPKNPLEGYIEFYEQIVVHEHPNVDLGGLISTFHHDRDHFGKMVASLIPILSMLTSDPLKDLLSPDFEVGHKKQVTDFARIIRNDQVCYLGLDSLADGTVGSAIGSMFLADMTAVAGDLYNYGIKTKKVVNIFVDEAAEVINNPTIQLLNKAGGAGFRMFIATQTFADFAARLGDENKARQVLANTNNKITLRVLDSETQKYISDGIPKIKARSMSVKYGHGIDANVHDPYNASYQEAATLEEADLIPPGVLSELAPLHYFARLSGGKTIKGRLSILVTE
ncbi:conjugative transfer system coupling protein TraD [Acidovorax sp. sic0104]|uniref:conjugative transfer system coupling protein TraD n=1 Tax=Acidovorax sp. sic0104 TaxID=2854784 RepID=UPI001C4789EB|nr:conjugative transfer system coupling protein TraD [Acidovorax sp. sic0104]MBV7542095.1 conjugative transfer system coupling protein TraD [Acidovorax sp. sic0104]